MRALVLALLLVPFAFAQEERLFSISIKGSCTNQDITVVAKDLVGSGPLRAEVRFLLNESGLWVEKLRNHTDPMNGTLTVRLGQEGKYLVTVNRPGYVPYERRINVSFCPECRNDLDCANDERCEGGECVPVTGECGFATNHTWYAYQCCSDADCAGDELCTNYECVKLTGCGYAEDHVFYAYECCSDADCGENMNCVDNRCEERVECLVDDDCLDNQRCFENRCLNIIGECGYAANHRWNPYECCSDTDCPSGYCLDDHTCSPAPREVVQPPTQPTPCTLLLLLLAPLALAVRR